MSLQNFTRPKDEKPYYYSSTVENGKVVRHDGDPDHAVYQSEIKEINARANRWHKWVEKNIPNAYDGLGILNPDIAAKHHETMRQFMDGERQV